MRPMQKRVLDALKTAIENAGFEFEDNHQFTNTGNVAAMKGFSTVATVAYSFQDGYCTLQAYPAGVKPILQMGRDIPKCLFNIGYGEYTKPDFPAQVQGLVASVEKYLSGR